jgi:hypothetical protein
MNLTKNFTLEEMLKSNTATNEGFWEQFKPLDDELKNLTLLCEKLLQPLRDSLPDGVMKVSSGYRCFRLNEAVGGVKNSQHLRGQATDVQYWEGGKMDNQKLFNKVKELDIDFDQCINENNGTWIHLSYNEGKNRRQFLNLTT